MKTVVIYLGGLGPAQAPKISGEIVATIAADSGLHLADTHNAKVDLVVGDMDSVDAALIAKYENDGSIISRFPHEKDETDFELALMAAHNYFADNLVVVGGGGQRPDHFLSNVSVLCSKQSEKWQTTMFLDNGVLSVCRPTQPFIASEIPTNIQPSNSNIISLIPISGSVHGVTTKGLKWKLDNATLDASQARGLSNEIIHSDFSVSVKSGSLAVII